MEDRELSTRDLAGTSPEDARGSSDDPDRVEEPSSMTADDTTDAADLPQERSRERDEADDVRNDADDDSGGSEASEGPLLPREQSERLVGRWQEIQAGFVDEPRESVAQADALVADLMQRLAAGFSNAREGLEAQWGRGDDVSTEDLRIALTRYRAFFDRLLSA
jgi:hypothetical protein